jgi:hypothetical protein
MIVSALEAKTNKQQIWDSLIQLYCFREFGPDTIATYVNVDW